MQGGSNALANRDAGRSNTTKCAGENVTQGGGAKSSSPRPRLAGGRTSMQECRTLVAACRGETSAPGVWAHWRRSGRRTARGAPGSNGGKTEVRRRTRRWRRRARGGAPRGNRELRRLDQSQLFLACARGPLVRVVPRGERSVAQEKEGAPRSRAPGTERPVAG
jgi:hypothetical protein